MKIGSEKMAKKEVAVNNLSARDFVDATDIKGIFLYRKDGYVLTYLRIYPFNLNLKSKPERQALTKNLSSSFNDDRKDFTYFTLPRELDLDKYKKLLKQKYSGELDIGKRHILSNMMLECARLSTSGENFEHQHFIKIWKKGTDKINVEADLLERLTDFKTRYRNVGIECEILQEPDIIKLCNLFGNSLQASFENVDKNAMYTPMMQL